MLLVYKFSDCVHNRFSILICDFQGTVYAREMLLLVWNTVTLKERLVNVSGVGGLGNGYEPDVFVDHARDHKFQGNVLT